MIEIILLIIGLIAGGVAGYFIGKSKVFQSADLTSQMGTIQNLTTQIAEMKGKFEAVEKSREEIEKSREKYNDEKEKRFKEFIENNQKLFKELKEGSDKSDKAKEEKIQTLMKTNEKFLNEQKESTEKFLKEQGMSREEIEKKRDAQVQDMKNMVTKFTQVISGTQQRGAVGETMLLEALKNSIKAGVVKKDLRVGSKNVEFAWDLGDGKYIPIDSKLPDVFEVYNEYIDASDSERTSLRKKIRDKVKKNISEIQKYQNQNNTIDNCILVLPTGIIEACPEIVGDGHDCQVFVCTYTDVFPIAHILQEQYARMKEEGDVGTYKKMVEQLFGILDKIMKKTESIDRALTTLTNANNDIKEEVGKGKRV